MNSLRSRSWAWVSAGVLAALVAPLPSYAENAVQFATFNTTDASGNLELRIGRCTSGLGSAHTIDCFGDAPHSPYVLVGGGAFVGSGGTLVESRPILTATGSAWRVSSTGTLRHIVTVYSVALHIKGLNAHVLKTMMSRRSVATALSSLSIVPEPATILGSGFSISRALGTNGANYSSRIPSTTARSRAGVSPPRMVYSPRR